MENNQIMTKEKLDFSETFRESLKIIGRSPKIFVLAFFTSIPLFCFCIAFDIALYSALIYAFKFLSDFTRPRFEVFGEESVAFFSHEPDLSERLIDFLLRIRNLVPLFLGTFHLLDLLNTIMIVYSASAIYGEKNSISLNEIVFEPIRKVGFKGPLFTSLYALLLESLTVLGLISLAVNSHLLSRFTLSIPLILFVPLFLVLLSKYVEWSCIWKMGMVISILEEKHGYIALGVSAYISRGNRRKGFFLMLVFFVLRLALRLPYLLMGWSREASGVYLVVNSMANVTMWVVFVVYFYDCKKRFLEKKIDVEEGKSANNVKH